MRPSVLEVSIENFNYNVNSVQKILKNNAKTMPIIKANAYGTFINTRIDLINQFDIVGVAMVDEGIELRKNGFKNEILVINPCYIDEIDDALENNLTISVSYSEFIKKLGSKNKNVRVHVEIETGMNRTGIKLQDLSSFIELIKQYQNIEIEGIYSHLSSTANDNEYTESQIAIFNQAVEIVKQKNIDLKYIHISASDGIINFPNARFNLVRPGIILYGYDSTEEINEKIDLKPVCKLKSKITFLKNVETQTSIGYGRTYKTTREAKIATIPIGYADGLKRCLSNKGMIYINGKFAPIVGLVCMDSFMADVTDVPNVKVGDDVWIWDNEHITIYDVAINCDTSAYEIMTSISERVPRIFIRSIRMFFFDHNLEKEKK